MTDTVAPEPTPEQAALMARVRRMMLIAGLTSALAVAVVLIAVGYRLYRGEGSPAAAATDIIATLPKGARIVSTAVAGERLVLTLDIAGVTEIRTFDAKTLKPAGKLKFVNEP
jgi:TRAP-type C4-dicarboxylate transport system permease small subunit